jgi:hypothetical protein
LDIEAKEGYENLDLCRQCGGTCCKRQPGETDRSDWPDDLLAALTQALISLRYAVDWREADGDEEALYFVRPAIAWSPRYEPKPAIDGSWGGTCTFLRDDGCELPLRRRPPGCRMMEPRSGRFGYGENHCWGHASHRSILQSWEPHQQTIHQAARRALDELGLPLPYYLEGIYDDRHRR